MTAPLQPIIVKKVKKAGAAHHGGAWKVAYADFVTAMMAFFMVMWLVATMPQEKLGGIADYFKNPSAVDGKSAAMAPGSMGPGGAGNAPIKMFDHMRQQQAPGPQTQVPVRKDDGREQRAKDAAEAKKLEALKQALEKAVAQSQALAPFKDQLLIDITPEGLRIQIVDEQNRPMFDAGSARMRDYSAKILEELAQYLNQVPNRVALSGHTDTAPYAGENGYSNWELSADRANAARRALVLGGLSPDKLARVVGLSSAVPFDKDNPGSPVNRRISIVVLNGAAERAAADVDTPRREGDGRGEDPLPADASANVQEGAAAAAAPAAPPAK